PRVHPSTPSKAHPLQLPTSLLLRLQSAPKAKQRCGTGSSRLYVLVIFLPSSFFLILPLGAELSPLMLEIIYSPVSSHTYFPRSSAYSMCGPHRTFSTKFWTHSPVVGHTVLSLDTQSFFSDTQSFRWTHSPFFGHTVLSLDTQSFLRTHSPFVGHTVLSLDTQSCRWTHSPLFRTHSPFVGHTVLSLDTQSCRWTHSPLFRTHSPFVGHTVLSLDTHPVVGHTVLSSDTQSFRWTHSPFFGHTVLSLDTQSFFFGHTSCFLMFTYLHTEGSFSAPSPLSS
uniref:Uncharacterized protein n=1 Tax=Oryzias latipes TaxID=8090 RepID=A0A3B3H2P3_ORYLA